MAEISKEASITNWTVQIVESAWFRNFILAVIIINTIVLGFETWPKAMDVAGDFIKMLDQLAIIIFTIEIAMKLFAYRLRFFKDGWNIFDFIIVAIAYVPSSAGLSVLRALRILRALRLISIVPSMRKVVQGLLSAIPSMGAVVILLVLTFYIAAVMATKLFGATFPQWFGTLGESLYTLFQVMTLESWSMGIVRPIMEVHPFAWLFFVPFVLVSAFVVLNLFIAIIVNSMQEEQGEASHQERDMILHEIRAMRSEVEQLKLMIEKNETNEI